MIEQLQHRAAGIKEMLRQQPERGADLLIDFAQRFAGDLHTEDEVILKKLDWMQAADASEKEQIIRDLEELADRIAANYNPAAVDAVLKKEQALAEAVSGMTLRNDVALRAEHLEKRYPGSRFTLQAEHIELRLGEITGLVGENATGKTTLLRMLAGDLAPDGGKIQYPLFDPNNKLHWPDLKRKIAYVPQELPPWLGSLRENLQYEAALHGLREAENRQNTEYIIQRLGLARYLDRSWHELSGGYKLRFALAKALVWKAQLLIVDEPLAFLDIKTQLLVLNDLKNLCKSLRHPMAIILSSQHLHEIEAVADQMFFMREGHLEYLGKTAEYGKERLHNVFELVCPIPFADFTRQLEGFPFQKHWSNGISYFVSAATDTSGYELLQYLHRKNIPVDYYRDISRSVKTRFYDEYL